ncbi:MAG TPA: SusD/RagB family nutrient-binding outer membrane lipoprotein [Longimicrobiaceae bacterium]|nr:SusD/RagB family nutrient-binding outer membrane lipoprotein [Longimicrobiaceae bacterium]
MTHHRWKGRALSAALVAGALAGCDFIKGVEANNPNAVPQATIDQLFVASQVNNFFIAEDQTNRVAAIWSQQAAGTDRQFSAIDIYNGNNEDLVDGEFGAVYVGGGLVDLRKAQAIATESNRLVYDGILKTYEAFDIGRAASVWGDIPYSQAVDATIAEPQLDKQEAVYASVQALLDKAITELSSGTGAGPGSLDLVYAGNAAKWTAAAWSLKARYYGDWAKAQRAGGASLAAAQVACGGDCIQKAIDAGLKGISNPANNWSTVHTTSATESNAWYQFQADRSGYIAAGFKGVDLLKTRNDPRLAIYYTKVETGANAGTFMGSQPGENLGSVSQLNFSATSRVPLVSCAQTQLTVAEMYYYQGNTAAAQTYLQKGVDCQNALYGVTIPVTAGLTGAALFTEIATQEYLADFGTLQAYNDVRRTCQPALTSTSKASVANMPRRFLYAGSERKTNSNIPDPGAQPARNTNDPVFGGC